MKLQCENISCANKNFKGGKFTKYCMGMSYIDLIKVILINYYNN